MSTRVLIVDDHTLFRAGLILVLSHFNDLQIVGEASNGIQALDFIKSLPVDLVIMDIQMPNMNGIEAATAIHQNYPSIRILMLSMYFEEEYILQALRAGAHGYITKDSHLAELKDAVNTVMSGETYVSHTVSRSLVNHIRNSDQGNKVKEASQLTERQMRILKLLASGLSIHNVAEELHLSPKTVETYRRQIMDRLNITNVASLVKYAIRNGLIKLED